MENPAIRCFLPRENPRISRPYTTGIRRRLPIELSRHYPVTSTGHSAGNDRMEMPNPLENAGKPHDLTGNTLSTTMFPAHSPCGGTADATDLKSVLPPPPQLPIESSTYDLPTKNSASYLAQMAVKFPNLEKLAKLWPRLRPDVKKMIVCVAVMSGKRKR